MMYRYGVARCCCQEGGAPPPDPSYLIPQHWIRFRQFDTHYLKFEGDTFIDSILYKPDFLNPGTYSFMFRATADTTANEWMCGTNNNAAVGRWNVRYNTADDTLRPRFCDAVQTFNFGLVRGNDYEFVADWDGVGTVTFTCNSIEHSMAYTPQGPNDQDVVIGGRRTTDGVAAGMWSGYLWNLKFGGQRLYYINDNFTNIVDHRGTLDDGALTIGSGAWESGRKTWYPETPGSPGPAGGYSAGSTLESLPSIAVFAFSTNLSSVSSAKLQFQRDSFQDPSQLPTDFLQEFTARIKTHYEPVGTVETIDADAIVNSAPHPGEVDWTARDSEAQWIDTELDVAQSLQAMLADSNYDYAAGDQFFLAHEWDWPGFTLGQDNWYTGTYPTKAASNPATLPQIEYL